MTSEERSGIVVWSERKAHLPMKPFDPAIALMNRLTYPQKFLLISLLFILPLVLVMYLLLTELSLRREFSQKEFARNVRVAKFDFFAADPNLALVASIRTRENFH